MKKTFIFNSEWEFYNSNVEENIASIVVDLGIKEIAPVKDYTKIIYVTIPMNNPREDGLSSYEESTIISEIGDKVVNSIIEKCNAIYVGRLTSDGNREFYFYFGNESHLEETLKLVMKQYPDYKYSFGINDDKDWNGYFEFLYPLPEELLSINNRKIVEQLIEYGDNLKKEREVFHYIYFKNEKDREKFIEKITKHNFEIIYKDFNEDLEEYGYSLKIKRVDKVEINNVDEYVLHLWNLANELEGDYDGWETSVEKE